MEQTKTKKDKIIEELEKQGYKVTFESNIPIFHITTILHKSCITLAVQNL